MNRFSQWSEAESKQRKAAPAGRKDAIFSDLPADIAYRCRGSSMEPTFYDGEIVFIHRQSTFKDGQIAACRIDGGITLKRLYGHSDGFLMVPDNKEFLPVLVPDLEVIGIAVARRVVPA